MGASFLASCLQWKKIEMGDEREPDSSEIFIFERFIQIQHRTVLLNDGNSDLELRMGPPADLLTPGCPTPPDTYLTWASACMKINSHFLAKALCNRAKFSCRLRQKPHAELRHS